MVRFLYGKISATLLPPHPPCRNHQQGFIFSNRVNFTYSAAFFSILFSCKQECWTKENWFRVVYDAFHFPLKQSHAVLTLNLQLLEGLCRKVGSAVFLHQTKLGKNKQPKPTDKKPFENVFSLRHNINTTTSLVYSSSRVRSDSDLPVSPPPSPPTPVPFLHLLFPFTPPCTLFSSSSPLSFSSLC